MANPSVLTPIGFDTPQLQYAVTPQVAQSLQPDSSPDTTGLNILSEANKSFQQTNQAQADSYKMQAQAMTSISQGQVAAAQALGQAESVNFQATAASGERNIRSLANLTNSVTNLVTGIQAREASVKEQVDKASKAAEAKRLADLKIELDNNQVKATTELENLQIDWIQGGRLGKEGTQAYRRAVGDVLAKYPMQPDTISTLTSKYYSPALDEAKKQDKLVFDAAVVIADTNRGVLALQFKQKLLTATAGLASISSGGEEAEASYMKTINDLMAGVQNNPELNDLTKLTLMREGLEQVLANSTISVNSRFALAKQQNGAVAVSNFINENAPKVMDGSLAQSTFDDQANEIRRGFGLPEKETTAPDKNLKRTIANLESNDTLDSLNRKGFISATEALEGNKKYSRSVALQLFLSPEALATMKATDPKLLDRNAKAGIELAEQAIKFFGPTTTARRKSIEDANLTLAKLQEGNYAKIVAEINKSDQDNTTNSLTASLRTLGLGEMPKSPPGRTGITQEQVDFLQANSMAVQRALADTVNGKSAEGIAYATEQAKFESMGFSANRGVAQNNLKAMESTIVEYNKKLEGIRLKGVQQLQPQKQPGQSPNFNGGSPGVQAPLMRRSFRGVSNVTMPFPVGAAKNMADAPGPGGTNGGYFGDSRTARNGSHEGVDFPVPTGTPALSMVYGTVTEIKRWDGTENASYGNLITVKGDDGREYRYAHLKTITAAMGQRVGPGEKVGFTGATGSPGGEHLHFEVYVGGNPVDPLGVLATNKFGQQSRQVRTAGSTAGLPQGEARIDPRAIPLGGGQFFLDGKIIKFAGGSAPSPSPSSSPEVDVYKLPEVNVNKQMHDIVIASGLTPIGWTGTNNQAKKGQPAGYYTFRNAAGGVLTQTAYGTGSKTYGINTGFDGKSYTPPQRPEVAPAVQPSRVDPSKAGRALMQMTGQTDDQGLNIFSVSLYDKQGRLSGSYMVNSGKPAMQGVLGSGGTTVAGSGAPLEYGSYDIGATEAAQDIPGMRSDFINITPKFKTQRSLLGIHFDGDRATDPGSMGCIAFPKLADFEAFKAAIKSNGTSRLDFTKGLNNVAVVAPIPSKMSFNSFNVQPSGPGSGHLDALRRAIIGQESGGNSRILNPDSGAVGLGQVMPDNIPSWTKKALGQSLTVDQFRNDAAAQIKTINHMMGEMFDVALKNSGGDVGLAVRKTASEWYSGQQRLYDDPSPQTFGAGSYPSIRDYTKSVYAGYLKQRGKGGQVAGKPGNAPPPTDPRRIPIGGGKFLLNGKIVAAAYTPETPIQASYASASRFDYTPSEEPDNYGYAQLDRDKPTLDKLNSIAKETGLPTQWLADVAALHGTEGIDGPEELESIASKLRGVKIKTPTDLVARVLGDASKVTDLGVHAGRRYDSTFSRFERTSAPTHLAMAPDCRLCDKFQEQTSFMPHRAELA